MRIPGRLHAQGPNRTMLPLPGCWKFVEPLAPPRRHAWHSPLPCQCVAILIVNYLISIVDPALSISIALSNDLQWIDKA